MLGLIQIISLSVLVSDLWNKQFNIKYDKITDYNLHCDHNIYYHIKI